jgi:hypothetical protein
MYIDGQNHFPLQSLYHVGIRINALMGMFINQYPIYTGNRKLIMVTLVGKK